MSRKTQGSKSRSVLISGASIAGPALGYWLGCHGFDVTVVERAPTVRSGGYPIDVRGTAVEVIAVWPAANSTLPGNTGGRTEVRRASRIVSG